MWRYYATSYGFKLDDLGREFTSRGVRYKITGIEPSRPKYPISAERVHDKRAFKFGASTVKMGLPMKMAA